MNAPILFLIFNRSTTTKLVFEQIKLTKPTRLYIASDGPRTDKKGENSIVIEIRDWVIQNINWDCKISTLFRENNLGCGKAVSSAIDWFF